MRLRHTIAALSAALLALSVQARATVMVPFTIDEMTAQAQLVALVDVQNATARWDHGHIVTDVGVSVTRVFKGTVAVGGSIVVRTPGGVVGNTGQQIAGAPVLGVGQQYVLFLVGAGGGMYQTIGFSQGVLPVRGTTVLPAVTVGIEFAAPRALASPRMVMPPEGMPLDAFAAALAR